MSTRAKLVFLSSIVGALTIIPGVHYVQKEQRETIRQGPIKDAARRQQRELTNAQKERVVEYDEQKRLRELYSSDQSVKGVKEITEEAKDSQEKS